MEENKEKDMEEIVDETAESNLDANQDILNEQAQGETEESQLERLNDLKKENEALNSKYLRLSADFQNFKKRVDKEKSDIYSYANEKLIGELLPVLDNFERAVSSAKDEGQGESILKGIELIQQQFLDTLFKNGVSEIPSVGETFDPNYHHAVLQEEHPDYEANTVVEVFQKGYTLNGKVIRPSMVKVSN